MEISAPDQSTASCPRCRRERLRSGGPCGPLRRPAGRGTPSKDATLGGRAQRRGRGHSAAPPQARHPHKGAGGEAAAGAALRSQPLAVAVSDLQLPSPPPLPTGPARRPPFCLLSPSVLDGASPFPGSGYLVSIRARGAGAGGCGGAAGPPAWCAAGVPEALSPAAAGGVPRPGPRAAGRTRRRVGRCSCARGRSCRRRRGSGRPGAARTPARHG